MVNFSSVWMVVRMWDCRASSVAESSFCCFCCCCCCCCCSSAVVPLVPVVGHGGAGWVAAEGEDDEAAEEVAVVDVAEPVEDAFEDEDAGDGFEKEEEIRQRRRTFHIV
jgi:hypothetical protein